MTFPLLRLRRLRWIGAMAALLLLWVTVLPGSAHADGGRWLDSPSTAELSREIAALRAPGGGPAPSLTPAQQRRLGDLTVLEQAIAASDDRSQVRNDSTHNLGLFTLSKKAAAGTIPSFGVLAPGHRSDDDWSVLGLYVPAGVGLQWGESGSAAAAGAARVVRLPEGEVLSVAEAAPPVKPAGAADQADEAVTYALSLPAFSVQATLPDLAVLPALSQVELDAEPESAPVD